MKLIKALVVMLVAVGMILPAVAVAEDRLSLSGEMRVRGWHTDYDLGDYDRSDGTQTWADQRLRIAGKIAVAEGVSITFRTDITESDWGSGNVNGAGRTTKCSTATKDVLDENGDPTGGTYTEKTCSDFGSQHWDRAHIDLVMGDFQLRAGQQYNAFGKTYAVDNQSNGITLFYNGLENTKANIFFMLTDDNGGRNESDAFLTGATIRPKFGDLQTAFFVANQNDGAEESVTLVGAYLTAMLGPVDFTAEVDFFTGDSDEKDVDAYGTNVWLDGSMALSDAFTIGAQGFFAPGDDEDKQYTYLGSGFGGWDPLLDVGTSLSNEQINYDRPFNVAQLSLGAEGGSAQLGSLGSTGARLYTAFKVSEDLNLGASVAYAMEEEDKYGELDVVLLAAGLVYQILPNASFQLQLQYTDGNVTIDDEDIDNDFDAFEAGTGLFVKF